MYTRLHPMCRTREWTDESISPTSHVATKIIKGPTELLQFILGGECLTKYPGSIPRAGRVYFRPKDKGAFADEQATPIHSGCALLAPIAQSLTKKGSKGRERSQPAPTCQTRVFAAAITFYNSAFHRASACHISVRFGHEKPPSNTFREIFYMCHILQRGGRVITYRVEYSYLKHS